MNMSQIFENICRDDHDLYQFLSLIPKLNISFLFEDNDELTSCKMFINKKINISIVLNKEINKKCFVIDDYSFNFGRKADSRRYLKAIKYLNEQANFNISDNLLCLFNNKLLIPWIYYCFEGKIDLEENELNYFKIKN